MKYSPEQIADLISNIEIGDRVSYLADWLAKALHEYGNAEECRVEMTVRSDLHTEMRRFPKDADAGRIERGKELRARLEELGDRFGNPSAVLQHLTLAEELRIEGDGEQCDYELDLAEAAFNRPWNYNGGAA